MWRDYDSLRRDLYVRARSGMKLGLERMTQALAQLDDPHRAYDVIHIAGTNGKGSVSMFVEAMLRQAGETVGTTTSPHLHSFCERFRLNGARVTEKLLLNSANEVQARLDDALSTELTFFEYSTLLALWMFKEAGVSVAVIEVGLGGRLDSTNLDYRRKVSVVTNVGLDHQAYLGNTLEAIAGEKLAIARPLETLVLGSLDLLRYDVTGPDQANVLCVGREILATPCGEAFSFSVMGTSGPELTMSDVHISLSGEHQVNNAATAIGAVYAHYQGCLEPVILSALAHVSWPGRLEQVRHERTVLLDGAHNVDGVRSLILYLSREELRARPKTFVFGVMQDKDWAPMLALIAGVANAIVCVTVPTERALASTGLCVASQEAAAFSGRAITVVEATTEGSAYEQALAQTPPDGVVVVAGSLHLVAIVRAQLLGIPQESTVSL